MATIKDRYGNELTIEFLPPSKVCLRYDMEARITFRNEGGHIFSVKRDISVEQSFYDSEYLLASSHPYDGSKYNDFECAARIIEACFRKNEACWCAIENGPSGSKVDAIVIYLEKEREKYDDAGVVLRLTHEVDEKYYIEELNIYSKRETIAKFARLVADEFQYMKDNYYSKLPDI